MRVKGYGTVRTYLLINTALAHTTRFQYTRIYLGAWRSLVARFVRVEEVVGSNPAAPTKIKNPVVIGGIFDSLKSICEVK